MLASTLRFANRFRVPGLYGVSLLTVLPLDKAQFIWLSASL